MSLPARARRRRGGHRLLPAPGGARRPLLPPPPGQPRLCPARLLHGGSYPREAPTAGSRCFPLPRCPQERWAAVKPHLAGGVWQCPFTQAECTHGGSAPPPAWSTGTPRVLAAPLSVRVPYSAIRPSAWQSCPFSDFSPRENAPVATRPQRGCSVGSARSSAPGAEQRLWHPHSTPVSTPRAGNPVREYTLLQSQIPPRRYG